MRAQASFEYMIIIGITLAAIIPAVYFIYSYVQTSNEDVIKTQINNIGKTIIDQAAEVYALGDGNRATMRFNMPAEVQSIILSNGTELSINYTSKSGVGQSVYFSDIPLRVQYKPEGALCPSPCDTGLLSNATYLQGNRKVQVVSNGTFVLLKVIS